MGEHGKFNHNENLFLFSFCYLFLFRLISGFSDTFEDLDFNPNDLLAAIDDLPSEESDRPITPEAPTAMPLQEKHCYLCGCLCEVWKRKWKCTNRDCNRWNGVVETPSMKPPSQIIHPLQFNWDRSYLDDIPMSDSSDKGEFKQKQLQVPEVMADISKIKQELMTIDHVAVTPEPVQTDQYLFEPVVEEPVIKAKVLEVLKTESAMMSPPEIPEVKEAEVSDTPGVRMEQYEPQKKIMRQGNRSRA